MEDDNKLYGLFWKLAAVVLCVGIVSISSCAAFRSHQVVVAIKAGIDPLDAGCAIGTMTPEKEVCAIRAARK
jgi:hypothetical protein